MNRNYNYIHKMNFVNNLYTMITGDSKISPVNIANLGNHQIISLASSINKILENVSLENIPGITKKTIQLY
jgi:hypothetical protein